MKEVAQNLINLLGGKENINKVECCMTRVRVSIKDPSKCEVDEIRKVEGVFGLFGKSNDLQIVVGPGDAQEIVGLMEKLLSN